MEKIIPLEYPIEYEKDGIKTIVNEIKLFRLKAKHLKGLPKNLSPETVTDADNLLLVLSCMNGLSLTVMEEIDVKDLTKIAAEVQSFL